MEDHLYQIAKPFIDGNDEETAKAQYFAYLQNNLVRRISESKFEEEYKKNERNIDNIYGKRLRLAKAADQAIKFSSLDQSSGIRKSGGRNS